MLTAVEFDHQLPFKANEVNDVTPNRMLAAESGAVYLAHS